MNIEHILEQTGAINAISNELGIDRSTALSGASALMPAILAGFQTPKASNAGGLGGLLSVVSQLGGTGLLDSVLSSAPTQVDKGNQILGQIFGSKDQSRTIAAEAATQSGVEPSILKKMLPILAMLAAGYIMKQGTNKAGSAPTPADQAALSATEDDASLAGQGGMLGELINAAGTLLRR